MILNIIFRTIFFYFVVIIAFKIMGKREVGELGVFDLIISMLISQIIAISIENYKTPILYAFIPIVVLVILQVVLSVMALKNKKIRDKLDGKESVIINKGKLNFNEMKKLRYSLSDLLSQLRDKSVKTVEDVEYAVLENNGKLSVFEKKKDDKVFPLPIILDGEIEKENLKLINKTDEWINLILKDRKINLNEVYYAFYKNHDVYIIKKD